MPHPPGILIVEDDGAAAAALAGQLAALGYALAGVAGSGEQAMQLMARALPAVALVDLDLRGSPDGIAIAARLRAMAGVPVIFLSGAADALSRLRLRGEDAASCLSTPPGLAELGAAIAAALQGGDPATRARDSAQRLTAILDGIAD